MRYSFALAAALCLVMQFQAAEGETAKCKVVGLHVCCGSCETAITDVLTKAKVDKVEIDRKTRTVTFEAPEAECQKAVQALYKAGFAGKGTINGKEYAVLTVIPEHKADTITIKDVHMCCGACQKAVKALFKDAEVSFAGKGTQKNVTIAGKALSAEQVLTTLQKAGFNGTIEAKK